MRVYTVAVVVIIVVASFALGNSLPAAFGGTTALETGGIPSVPTVTTSTSTPSPTVASSPIAGLNTPTAVPPTWTPVRITSQAFPPANLANIPRPTTNSTSSSQLLYVVREGDTMQSIGDQFGVAPGDLMLLNGISDPSTISAGQTLRLPSSVRPRVPSSAASSQETPTTSSGHSDAVGSVSTANSPQAPTQLAPVQQAAPPTNTPRPTSTPRPTNTPQPTATSTATPTEAATPTETATPRPTATPSPAFDYVVSSWTEFPRPEHRSISYIRGKLIDRNGNLVPGARFEIKSDGTPLFTATGPDGERDGTVVFAVTKGRFAVRVLGGRSQDAGWMVTGETGNERMSDFEFVFQTTR